LHDGGKPGFQKCLIEGTAWLGAHQLEQLLQVAARILRKEQRIDGHPGIPMDGLLQPFQQDRIEKRRELGVLRGRQGHGEIGEAHSSSAPDVFHDQLLELGIVLEIGVACIHGGTTVNGKVRVPETETVA
jgi:hypothetical protein